MFVKDRDRQAGGESWIPPLFAFFWIVLAGFAGAYIYKMVADDDLLSRESAGLTALGSGAAAAQGLSLEERQAIIDSRRAQDRTIAELKNTVATLTQQVKTLTARLGGEPMPPAAPAPTAAAPEVSSTPPAAPPEPRLAPVPPLPQPDTSRAVVTSPPAADTETPMVTASPATPQTDDPEADDEGEEEDRSAAPQALAETVEAETEAEQVGLPAEETIVVEEESQAVTYGIPAATPREESPQDETVRSLQMAAATDPGMKFGIEIGTVEEQKGLRPMWRDLLTKHAALVAGLEARRVMAPDKKWRLIAGPFANPVEATQACALFKKAELPCEATVFAGDSL
jgi:hypothetical protein